MKTLVPVWLLLALTLLPAIALGQESRAILSGNVTDPQGAFVPEASVEVQNLETNVSTKTATNDRGLYTIPPLNPGTYSITVSASGFKTVIRRTVGTPGRRSCRRRFQT
jgi:protocatechuate 3,4-dioxygenase beta subunit